MVEIGRPESDDPREHTLCIRTTRSEKDEIDRWIGARNRSEVLRNLILREVRTAAPA